MKKIVFIALIISLIGNVFMVYKFLIQGDTYQYEGDKRLSIRMKYDHREFVMSEMRHFVEGVQRINEVILTKNPKLIIEAGIRSGRGVGEHAPKGLIKSVPLAFKKIGMDTHRKFDEIAETAKTNFDPKVTQKQLDGLLRNCIACHSSFRIDADRPKR